MFNLMDNISTIKLTGAPEQVMLPASYMWVWVRNDSSETMYMSRSSTVSSGANGSISIPTGGMARLLVSGNTFYVNGNGVVLVYALDTDSCPFRDAPTTSGGGVGGDYYTKVQSDAKYAQKSEIPTTLPANGGNADTVGGVGIANLRQITQTVLNTLPAVPNGEGDFLVNCDTSDVSFPYWYGHLSIRYGSYTGEYVAIFRTTGNDNKVYYNTYLTNHWSGWQEISAAPIKSTQISGTTNATGNIQLWAITDKKVPVSVIMEDRYGYIFRSSLGFYCVGIFHPDNHIFPADEAISGTVYYIEKNTINVG